MCNRSTKIILTCAICSFLFCHYQSDAQTILNGSFENNTAVGDQINLTNPQFNSMMANCTGFGTYGDIDIITSNAYCGLAQNGNWYIAFTGSGTDMVAMELSQPLVQGSTYSLTFYDRGCNSWTPYPFDIGVSSSNTSFGDTVLHGSAVPLFGVWTQRTVTFVAPNNGLYITITMDAGSTGDWGQIDNFAFTPTVFSLNNCFGDSTIFTITNTGSLAGVQWNFDDNGSGANNLSSVFNPSHLFSAPGSYNVQLIQYYLNGVTDTIYTSVTIYPYPQINLGNDTTLCTGNSLTLNAISGYTSYLWQDGNTNATYNVATAGTYFVEVSNNGCLASDSINIQYTICATPSISFAASDTNFCEKTCLDFFDLSTNNPTTWQWFFSGASPDTSTAQNPTGICYNSYGNFSVTLIACNGAGCDSLTINQFINEFQNPVDSIWVSNDTLWSLPFPSYQWYNTLSGAIAGATNQYFVASNPGSYYCVVDDSIGCVATSNILVATGLTPGPSSGGEGSIVITPNPVSENLNINLQFNKNENVIFEIYDLQGRIIQTGFITSKNSVVDVHTISKGVYGYRIISENKIIGQGKFLKM